MNSNERMIELYQERLDGYEHEYVEVSYGAFTDNPTENVRPHPAQVGFSTDIEYKKIEKPQTLEDASQKYKDKEASDCPPHVRVQIKLAHIMGARWALKTGWKGDE